MDEFDRDAEIGRLLDLLPASSRMKLRVIPQPQQVEVLTVPFPWPWRTEWPVQINFQLWQNLTEPQRDLLFLRTDRWLRGISWFRPGWSQGLILAGSVAVAFQGIQGDGVGVIVGLGLAGVSLRQLLKNYRSPAYELQADEAAVTLAQRREYTETEAARALLEAIEQQAQLERRGLNFTELVRSQNLRTLAGLSTVTVPSQYRSPER
ncbi:MAG: DUF3318 domain-containing protein [Gloeomargarita sp. HHBFW_bins_162]